MAMLAGHPTSQPLTDTSKTDPVLPGAVIDDFLGLGLAYSEWPMEVKKQGYSWYPKYEKVIIEREWEFFRAEIQHLRSEPNKSHSSRVQSNSLTSILKQLKGEPWMEGCLDERGERLRTHRLLGKNAKPRCLQNYVRKWDRQVTSAKSATATALMREVPGNPSRAFDSTRGVPEEWPFGDSFEPEARSVLENRGTNMDTPNSMFDYFSQLGSSLMPHSTQPGPYSVTTGDLDHTKLPPVHNYVEGPASSTHNPIVEDAVPISANDNESFHSPEPEPNIFSWMVTNQVSETFESLEPAASGPETGFHGTFLNSRDSLDLDEFLVLDDREMPEDASAAEDTPMDPAEQHNSHTEDLLTGFSRLVPSPRSNSKSRKRRRQNTSDLSLNIPIYGNSPHSTTGYVASDGDTMMSNNERHFQPISESVSTASCAQMPPSEPLTISPYSVMTPKTTYEIRTQIELESELQRTRQELAFVKKQHQIEIEFLRKQHQEEMDSSMRTRNEAEAEICELREKMREMQKSTEYYEGLARNAISENIILQDSNSRKKSVSERPPTGSKEREHGSKQAQFPSSKNPRPLSLTLRPASALRLSPSPPRRPSPSNVDDASTLRLPVAMSFTSRPVTPDSNQHLLENPDLANIFPKSTGRRCRPHTSESSHKSFMQPPPTISSSKSAGRNNGAGSIDSIAAPNPNIPSGRGLSHLMQKLSSSILRKQFRDDSAKEIPTVPSLPQLEASVPLDRQMAGVLVDGNKRLTNDSGYDSLEFETSSRASMADDE